MELKEQLNTIREVIRENIDHGKLVDAIMTAIAAYGNNCYNQALDDAAENATTKSETVIANGFLGQFGPTVIQVIDKQSILNLKKILT